MNEETLKLREYEENRMVVDFHWHKKQLEALRCLKDETSEVVLYGGKANSGKSWLGMYWVIKMALMYPNSVGAICRKTVKEIKQTSLKTFIKVANRWGLEFRKDYKINNIESKIVFSNGSEVLFIPLAYVPSDPDGDFMGGLEFSYAVIEELPNISQTYYEILYSRIRFLENKTQNWKIKGKKLLCTCNPSSNWVKTYFYDRYVKSQLPIELKFVSTSGNYYNPFRGDGYEKSLSLLSEQNLKRLEEGDWDYASANDQLFINDKIENILTDLLIENKNDRYYISADIARFGKDDCTIIVWKGLTIIEVFHWNGIDTKETSLRILNIQKRLNIPKNQVICDSDGVGGGVVDMLKCYGFVNNSKPLKGEKFDNLKSQCYFKLSKTDWHISNKIDEKYKQQITTELKAIRDKSDDVKYKINSKDEQKLLLGKSPDFSDAIMMRMWFEYYKSNGINVIVCR